MRLLDLFSGIGGFSLGLERAGMRTVAFCEIDPYCRRVLKKHWPHVPCYGDIRTLTAARLAADGIIANRNANGFDAGQIAGISQRQGAQSGGIGGFPCQDISVAGKGAGIGGERSGLWSEYRRLVGELRPRYVIVENVTALLGRGLSTVLGDLAALGYDAEWHCIPASAVGAPHRRDRIWIVAYPNGAERWAQHSPRNDHRPDGNAQWQESADRLEPSGEDVANATVNGRNAWRQSDATKEPRGRQSDRSSVVENVSDADRAGREQQRWGITVRTQLAAAQCGDWWRIEPDVGRVAHGVPNRVHRLRALGNAVIPQIPELIGRAIMQETLVNRA